MWYMWSGHHASANDNVQSSCPCASHHLIPTSRKRREGRDESTAPAFQDTSWRLPSIDWNVVTCPHWLQGRMGNVLPILDGYTFWVFYWGKRGNRYWSNYAAAAYSCHIPVPVTSCWESERPVFSVFVAPAFFLLLLLLLKAEADLFGL